MPDVRVYIEALIGESVASPNTDERQALDRIVADCGGDVYAAALTLLRILHVLRAIGGPSATEITHARH